MTVEKRIFRSLTVLLDHYFVISTVQNLIFSSVPVLSGYPGTVKNRFFDLLTVPRHESTVQNSIFRNWIRKKWIFVRLKIHFFVFQPYVGGRIPWKALRKDSMEDPAKCFPVRISGIFRRVPRPVNSKLFLSASAVRRERGDRDVSGHTGRLRGFASRSLPHVPAGGASQLRAAPDPVRR